MKSLTRSSGGSTRTAAALASPAFTFQAATRLIHARTYATPDHPLYEYRGFRGFHEFHGVCGIRGIHEIQGIGLRSNGGRRAGSGRAGVGRSGGCRAAGKAQVFLCKAPQYLSIMPTIAYCVCVPRTALFVAQVPWKCDIIALLVKN